MPHANNTSPHSRGFMCVTAGGEIATAAQQDERRENQLKRALANQIASDHADEKQNYALDPSMLQK